MTREEVDARLRRAPAVYAPTTDVEWAEVQAVIGEIERQGTRPDGLEQDAVAVFCVIGLRVSRYFTALEALGVRLRGE
jgi:hypothetical protein